MFYIGLIFLAAGAGIWAVYHFALGDTVPRMPCFFDKVLGIYCPGCGGTRALTALVHGRLLEALWYHPLIPYLAVVGGGFMLTQGLERLGIPHLVSVRGHRPDCIEFYREECAPAVLGHNDVDMQDAKRQKRWR